MNPLALFTRMGLTRQLVAAVSHLLRDSFTTTRAAGSVHNTAAEPGPGTRVVTDLDSVITIGQNVLQLASPSTTGWGRTAISYSSGGTGFTRQNGLAFLWRFRLGDTQGLTQLATRMAVGVFNTSNPNALTAGQSLVISDNATQASSISLARTASLRESLSRIKHVPLYVLGVVRAEGMVFYVSSLSGVPGIPAWPNMRPIGAVEFDTFSPVYPVYTRFGTNKSDWLYALEAEVLSNATSWYGLATHANNFITNPLAHDGPLQHGGTWKVVDGGAFLHDSNGIGADQNGWNRAFFQAAAPVGLLKVKLSTGSSPGRFGIWNRVAFSGATPTPTNSWYYDHQPGTQHRVIKVVSGTETILGNTGAYLVSANTSYTFQVLDDGERMRYYMNDIEVGVSQGNLDSTHVANLGVGIGLAVASTTRIQNIEVHPRTQELPITLRSTAPHQPTGSTLVASDSFDGSAGHLAGQTTPVGGFTWTQRLNTRTLNKNGSGSLITASGTGHGAYTIPWSSPSFADLRIVATPAASTSTINLTAVIFYQDADNYVDVTLYRSSEQPGNGELEAFVVRNGGAGINIARTAMGSEIVWGQPHTLRATFDGNEVVCYLGSEPIISFSLRQENMSYGPLSINHVGVYIRGSDSGASSIQSFEAYSNAAGMASSPSAWWDADDAATFTAPSGVVEQWRDKSGNAVHLNQTTSGARPILTSNQQNSRPAVVFDGTKALRTANGALQLPTVHAFAVMQSTQHGRAMLGVSHEASAHAAPYFRWSFFHAFDWANHVLWFRVNSNEGASTGNYMLASPTRIYEARTLSGEAYGNGVLAATTTGATVTYPNSTPFLVGENAAGEERLVGKVCEIVIYNRALTAQEVSNTLSYLATKWGITL
jgi:hypothetical protein